MVLVFHSESPGLGSSGLGSSGLVASGLVPSGLGLSVLASVLEPPSVLELAAPSFGLAPSDDLVAPSVALPPALVDFAPFELPAESSSPPTRVSLPSPRLPSPLFRIK